MLDFILEIEIILLLYIFSIMFTLIVHELGKLLISFILNFDFISFRILSFMLISADGKLKFKRLFGKKSGFVECSVKPKSRKDTTPKQLALYTISGAIFNGVVATISLILFLTIQLNVKLSQNIFIFITIVNFTFMFMLLIPFSNKKFRSESLLAKEMLHNPMSREIFFDTVEFNYDITCGKSLEEIKFVDRDVKEGSVSDIFYQIYLTRKVFNLEITENIEEINKIYNSLKQKENIYYRTLIENITLFKIYYSLINNEEISNLLNEKIIKIIKKMNKSPRYMLADYAIEKIMNKEDKKADEILKRFEKIKKDYPFPGTYTYIKECMKKVDLASK